MSLLRIRDVLPESGVVLLVLALCAAAQEPKPAGGVLAGEPKFRLVRSITGSKGAERDGRYIIEDARTVFYIPEDKQVVAYFEWEGPLGKHRFEGVWKNPGGKVMVVSDFEYEAKQKRFAAHWTLLMGEGMATGLWNVEARIDGELAASHNFQIVAAPRPELPPSPPPPLTSAEIYQIALASTIAVEKLASDGRRAGEGSGFALDDAALVTSFEAIDGASRIRLVLPGGQRIETDQVLAWNRWQDWAVLRADVGSLPRLKRGRADSVAVGDVCFYLDVAPEGNRVITETAITGRNSFPRAGERLNFNYHADGRAIGSPLLNEYGEVVGVLGASLMPGARSEQASVLAARVGLAVPITLIPRTAAEAQPSTLAELRAKGELIPPLAPDRYIGFASLTRGVAQGGRLPVSVQLQEEFSRRDPKMVVYVSWSPREKYKGLTSVRVYNLDNRLLVESKPTKANLRLGEGLVSFWELKLAGMAAGTYRIDVVLGSEPVWRRFFRITE